MCRDGNADLAKKYVDLVTDKLVRRSSTSLVSLSLNPAGRVGDQVLFAG